MISNRCGELCSPLWHFDIYIKFIIPSTFEPTSQSKIDVRCKHKRPRPCQIILILSAWRWGAFYQTIFVSAPPLWNFWVLTHRAHSKSMQNSSKIDMWCKNLIRARMKRAIFNPTRQFTIGRTFAGWHGQPIWPGPGVDKMIDKR